MENVPLHNIETLRMVGFWPGEEKLDVARWLNNFETADTEIAKILLRSFIFLSDRVVDTLMADAYVALLGSFANGYESSDRAANAREPRLLFTFPTGEKSHCTDSGFSFARKMRQLFDIDEEFIKFPHDAVKSIAESRRGSNVDTVLVLVDDFAGTGQQLSETLCRKVDLEEEELSIDDLARRYNVDVHYCVLAATSRAKNLFERKYKYLHLHCPHILGKKYGVHSENTAMIPSAKRDAVLDLITKYSDRYMRAEAVPDYVGMYGFNELGLTIAFQHSVPDATLPIFWSCTADWNPLYRRS